MQEQAASSLPSSSERSSTSAAALLGVKEGIESDDEIRRVPEFGGEAAGPTTSGRETASADGTQRGSGGAGEASRRKRARNPADKESRRIKRLLRNRVSAQQARERKKAYLTELEQKAQDLEMKNSELEEKFSTLHKENLMLRHILKNTTVGRKTKGSTSDQ